MRKAALGILVALLLAGCSGEDESPDARSSSAPTTATAPASDTVSKIVGCLKDQGWDVSVEPGDSVVYEGDSSQADNYSAAYRACSEQFEGEPVALEDLSDAQWRDLYEQEMTTAECLRGDGIEIPEIPAYETFVERYKSESPWTSYGQIPSVGQDRWTELETNCPQPHL